ncbi:hypothetical protein BH20VER1_BH20VER1_26080 [soil metagenome]
MPPLLRFSFALGLQVLFLAALNLFDDWTLEEMPVRFVACGLASGLAFLWAVGLFPTSLSRGQQALLFWSVAVVLRLIALPIEVGDDFWRYQWEGKVQNAGFNPYIQAPDAPELAQVREEFPDFSKINHRHFRAIYPPGAELIFATLTRISDSPLLYKLLFTGADLATAALLLLLIHGPARYAAAACYAWNPLVVYCFAGAAHFDSLMILPMMAAILLLTKVEPRRSRRSPHPSLLPEREGAAGKLPLSAPAPDAVPSPAATRDSPLSVSPRAAAPSPGGERVGVRANRTSTTAAQWLLATAAAALFGVAISIKLIPLLLLPLAAFALGRRALVLLLSLAVPAALSLLYGYPQVPIWESLGNFAHVTRLNDLFWWLIEETAWPNPRQKNYRYNVIIIAAVCLVSLVFYRNWRRGMLWVLGTAIILTPVLHPWYLTWLLPFAAWRRVEPWLVLSISLFAYFLFWNERLFLLPWRSELWLRAIIMIPPLLSLLFYLLRERASPPPPAPAPP